MKTSYATKQTALTAALVVIIGAHFTASFREAGLHATNLSQVSTEAAGAGGASTTPAEPPKISISPAVEAGAAEAAKAAKAAAHPAPPTQQTAAGGRSVVGRGRTSPLREPPPATESEQSCVPETVKVRVCGRDESIFFVVAKDETEAKSKAWWFRGTQPKEAFDRLCTATAETDKSHFERPALASAVVIGDAHSPDMRNSLARLMQQNLRDLPQNRDCETDRPAAGSTEQRTQENRCEVNAAGERYRPADSARCNMNLLSELSRGNKRGDELFDDVSEIVERLKDNLRSLAEGRCGGRDGDHSSCRSESASKLERDILNKLNVLRSRVLSSSRRDSEYGNDRRGMLKDFNRLVASVKQVLAGVEGQRLAETARRENDRARDDLHKLTDDAKDAQERIRRNCGGGGGRQGAGDAFECQEALNDLKQLRDDRADLYEKLSDAKTFDRLNALARQMDPLDARDLVRDARQDSLGLLAQTSRLNLLTGNQMFDRNETQLDVMMRQALQGITSKLPRTELPTELTNSGGGRTGLVGGDGRGGAGAASSSRWAPGLGGGLPTRAPGTPGAAGATFANGWGAPNSPGNRGGVGQFPNQFNGGFSQGAMPVGNANPNMGPLNYLNNNGAFNGQFSGPNSPVAGRTQ